MVDILFDIELAFDGLLVVMTAILFVVLSLFDEDVFKDVTGERVAV